MIKEYVKSNSKIKMNLINKQWRKYYWLIELLKRRSIVIIVLISHVAKSVFVEMIKTLSQRQEYKNYAKKVVKKQDGMLTVANV